MRRGIGRLRAGGSGGGDADAAAWAAAVTANGGTYSAATLTAVAAFCVSAKAKNYWSKLLRINLICGNQLAAALVPLKALIGNATDTNVGFVGGNYTEATGLTGNSTTKYLTTGAIPTSITLNDTHLSLYNRSSAAAGTGGVVIGAVDAASPTQAESLFAPFSDGNYYSDEYNVAAGRVSVAAGATPYGHIIGTRTAANAHTIYRNGASVATNATTGGTRPTVEIYVMAFNQGGTPSFGGITPICAGYSIGSGLSSTDAGNFYTDMQTFQTAMSRNV